MLSGKARAGPSPGELLGPRGRVGEVSHKGHTPSRPDPARCLFARGEARPRAGTQQLPSCCRSWEAPRQPRAQHAALRDFAGSILPPVTGPARGEGTRVAAERAHVATGGVMLFKGRGCSYCPFFFARTRRTARKPLESTTSQRGLGLATIGAIVAFCAATRGAPRRSCPARRPAASISPQPPLRRPRDAAAARRAAICGTRRRNADPSGILARPAAPTPAMTRAGCYGAGAPHENSEGAPRQNSQGVFLRVSIRPSRSTIDFGHNTMPVALICGMIRPSAGPSQSPPLTGLARRRGPSTVKRQRPKNGRVVIAWYNV